MGRRSGMQKSNPVLERDRFELVKGLPRIDKSYKEEALEVIPLAKRANKPSTGEEKVLICVVRDCQRKIGMDSSCRQPRGDNEIIFKKSNVLSKFGKTG
jgi:hypothetical protein